MRLQQGGAAAEVSSDHSPWEKEERQHRVVHGERDRLGSQRSY
jgi:hypothetical protein